MRRALAALLAAVAALPAAGAPTIVLQQAGAPPAQCDYSKIEIDPAGNVVATCADAPPPPPPPPPPIGCVDKPLPVAPLGSAGTVNHLTGISPFVKVYALPASQNGFGDLGLYSSPATPKIGPTVTEIKVSQCRGDFTDQQDGCYQASGALDGTQVDQAWAPRYTPRFPNKASFIANKRCLVTAPGPWYINVRMSYPANACPGRSQCGWDPIWHVGSSQ